MSGGGPTDGAGPDRRRVAPGQALVSAALPGASSTAAWRRTAAAIGNDAAAGISPSSLGRRCAPSPPGGLRCLDRHAAGAMRAALDGQIVRMA